MRKTYIVGGITVAVAIFVISLAVILNQKALDISGKYVLRMDNRYVNTFLTVKDNGQEFILIMENDDGLRSIYTSKKMVSGDYTLTDNSGGNKISEYRLHATKEGLRGTVDLLPLGKVEIYFERVKDEAPITGKG